MRPPPGAAGPAGAGICRCRARRGRSPAAGAARPGRSAPRRSPPARETWPVRPVRTAAAEGPGSAGRRSPPAPPRSRAALSQPCVIRLHPVASWRTVARPDAPAPGACATAPGWLKRRFRTCQGIRHARSPTLAVGFLRGSTRRRRCRADRSQIAAAGDGSRNRQVSPGRPQGSVVPRNRSGPQEPGSSLPDGAQHCEGERGRPAGG